MSVDLYATAACECSGERLTFSCDPEAHLVVVRGEDGTPRAAFGGLGTHPGALDTPIDVVLVQPEFYGEPHWMSTDARYLAVADYGNARVQVYELDGSLVASLHEDFSPIGGPTRLRWQAPFLEVEGVEGGRMQIHLAAALLAHAAANGPASRTCRLPRRESWHIC